MLVDREGLWFRVLIARYGIERGRLREGGRSGSSWWREIVRIRDGVADIGGGWFGESVVRKVGDGVGTFFWTDTWLDGIPLCERFQHLFDLTINKSSTVAECFSLGWGPGGAAWDQSLDVWHWRPDPIRGYSVREAYQILTSHQSMPLADVEDLIWHKQVPLKVFILAWRLLRNRLPTKDNLANRGIITLEAQSCVAGCGALESAQHLFISCNTFGSLWSSVRSWLGVSSADPLDLADHFRQFTFIVGGVRARRAFLQLIWLICIWTIWKERNNRLFRKSEQSVSQLMDKLPWLKRSTTHHLFHHHSGEKISDLEFTTTFEAAGTEVDYNKEEKHHKHVAQLGKVGAVAAGAIALLCVSYGGRKEGRLGSGAVSCGHGRRDVTSAVKVKPLCKRRRGFTQRIFKDYSSPFYNGNFYNVSMSFSTHINTP
ncbi:hypothetical protein TSUD_288280 [Trifolium subterraneum]|uniref:Reverse transcriptase zinc-binding domain-containing protein n=1 Tax=Trifolium subterraneum TaxID=3900 RepID=A0A2Z6PAC4_TRISU|nr:hypothetical protein TSUD_288280 [Trifolium subterraneum]